MHVLHARACKVHAHACASACMSYACMHSETHALPMKRCVKAWVTHSHIFVTFAGRWLNGRRIKAGFGGGSGGARSEHRGSHGSHHREQHRLLEEAMKVSFRHDRVLDPAAYTRMWQRRVPFLCSRGPGRGHRRRACFCVHGKSVCAHTHTHTCALALLCGTHTYVHGTFQPLSTTGGAGR